MDGCLEVSALIARFSILGRKK